MGDSVVFAPGQRVQFAFRAFDLAFLHARYTSLTERLGEQHAYRWSLGAHRWLDGVGRCVRRAATLVEFAFENGSDRLVMAMFNDTNAIVDDAWK